jgi:phosphoribosylformylglycinamidine synthase
MSMASGIGAVVKQLNDLSPIPVFFGEDQGRYLVTIPRERVDWFYEERVKGTGVSAHWIGTTRGTELKLGDARAIAVAAMREAHESWFPQFMDA